MKCPICNSCLNKTLPLFNYSCTRCDIVLYFVFDEIYHWYSNAKGHYILGNKHTDRVDIYWPNKRIHIQEFSPPTQKLLDLFQKYQLLQ